MFEKKHLVTLYVTGSPQIITTFEVVAFYVNRLNDYTITVDGIPLKFSESVYVDFKKM